MTVWGGYLTKYGTAASFGFSPHVTFGRNDGYGYKNERVGINKKNRTPCSVSKRKVINEI